MWTGLYCAKDQPISLNDLFAQYLDGEGVFASSAALATAEKENRSIDTNYHEIGWLCVHLCCMEQGKRKQS